jgi:hypothetical protein
MGKQRQLEFAVSIRDQYDDGTYPDGFWEWIERNWHVYDAAVRVARQGKRIGYDRWSVQGVLEILRWQTKIRENSQGPLKINHNARSGLARLIMAREPDLDGFFETRSHGARHVAYRLDGERYGEARP